METLAVTAVLVILLGISIVAAAHYRDLLKIIELDNSAREIYMAAENRAVLLSNGGRLSTLVRQTDNEVVIPLSAAGGDSGADQTDAYYISSEEAELVQLLPVESIDPALWDGQFYIVYEPVSGCVTDVFYTDDEIGALTADGFQAFYDHWTTAERSARMNRRPMLGYYGGGSAQGENVEVLSPKVQVVIDNGERLTVTVSCWLPDSIPANTTSLEVALDCGGQTVSLTDPVFQARRVEQSTEHAAGGSNTTQTWVLDELDSEYQFQALFQYTGKPELGGDFQVTARLTSDGGVFEPVQAGDENNSLFEEHTHSGDTAYIKYLRHLQNLDVDFSGVSGKTGAVQMADIHCSGNTSYGDYLFQPIQNDFLLSYNGNRNEIRGLNVEAQNAGLFSTVKNATFTNIRLVNTAVHAQEAGNAGALAGQAVHTAFLDCWVYWEAEQGGDLRDILGSDASAYRPQITGSTAGGLVGRMSGGSIQSCLSATIVSGTQRAGGLIGEAVSGSITITGSYADCYLTGASAAGLVGELHGSCALTDCYAAGFLVGESNDRAAGLCLGTGRTEASNVYSVVRYPAAGSAGQRRYMLTENAEADNLSNTYYLNAGAGDEAGIAGMRKDYAEMTAGPFKQAMGSSFTWKTAGDSRPYNLREHLSLVVYSFPGLDGMPHYGDWGAQFKEPSLVYYEQYDDGTYGFSGGNARYLIGELKDETILSDGYAVAFLSTDLQQSHAATITYRDFSGGAPQTVHYATDTQSGVTLIPASWTNDEGNHASYYLALLPAGMVNTQSAGEEIYQYLRFDLTIGSEVSSGVYFYNPHFAETVIPYMEKEGDAAIQWSAESARVYAREQLLEKGYDILSVRTPRHLYALGHFAAYYHNTAHTCTFYQRLELDYAAYTGYGLFTDRSGKYYAQPPIGDMDKPFTGVYDGGCRAIRGVVFQIPEGGGSRCAGLFGCSAGVLRNIVYRMDPEDTLTAARDDGSGALYIGGLLGINQGTVTNCAVSGARLDSMTFGATVYMGGLAGQNEGVIQTSAAECAGLTADSSSYGRAYMGGLVGQNTSTVATCYAVGRLDATADSTSSAWACGFAGSNSGHITDSYAAADLRSSGLTVELYGFCTGSQSGSSYLNEGNFTYRERAYTASYAQNGGSGTGKPYGALTSSSVAVAGMTMGAHTDGGEAYPYPAVVVDAGRNPIHYGQFPKPIELGQIGIYYWEELGSGTYNISLLAVKPSNSGAQTITKLTTLSTAHDDGLLVNRYGYGYYQMASEAETLGVRLEAKDLDYRSSGGASGALAENTPSEGQVNQALSDLMPGFVFCSYLSFDPNSATDRGLYPTGSPDGTMTLVQGPLRVTFGVNPHFADAMSVKSINGTSPAMSGWTVPAALTAASGTAENPYGVRSVAQLELINWNKSTQNTRTVLQSNGAYFPYLSVSDSTGKYVWVQSHDLRGQNTAYSPIAEYYDASSSDKGQLYGWFGGTYDGQGYRIEDVSIQAGIDGDPSSVAGLFGVVYNGTLRDIILYSSDGQGRITGSYHTGTRSQWSAIGGLAGVAASSGSGSAIINCAVAGYTIDATFYNDVTSGNTWGGAEIGGLVGFTNCDLEGCSAVTTVEFTKIRANDNVRVGGLVGSAQSTIRNSYAGGSIVFAEGSEISFGSTTVGGDTFKAFLYIGGLVGGSYFKPLTAEGRTIGPSNRAGWDVTLENCYSFVELPMQTAPAAKNKIKALYALGGVGELNPSGTGDNKADHGESKFLNCYYLDTSVLKNNTSAGLIAESQKKVPIRETFRTDLEQDGLTGITYQKLAGLEAIEGNTIYQLLKDFSPVTSAIGSFSVAGKYSYAPDSRPELQGINYPFPTILTRNRGLYHVHYGQWPLYGIERSSGGRPIALDLLSEPVHQETLELSTGVYSTSGIWSVDGYDGAVIHAALTPGGEDPQKAELVVRALKVGTTRLTIHYKVGTTDYMLSLTVNVTEELELSPREIALFPGGETVFPLEPWGKNRPLPVENLVIREAGALQAGLTCSVVQGMFEAGEDGGEDKLPSVKLGADPQTTPGPEVVNVGYTYIHGRDENSPGTHYTRTGAITVQVLELPEAVFDGETGHYVLDFRPYKETYGFRLHSALCGPDQDTAEAAINEDGTVLTIGAVKAGTQRISLSLSITMEGLTHSVKLELPVEASNETQDTEPNGT